MRVFRGLPKSLGYGLFLGYTWGLLVPLVDFIGLARFSEGEQALYFTIGLIITLFVAHHEG